MAESAYLSSPTWTRQDETTSLLQYLHPLTILQGKLIESANTYEKTHFKRCEIVNRDISRSEETDKIIKGTHTHIAKRLHFSI